MFHCNWNDLKMTRGGDAKMESGLFSVFFNLPLCGSVFFLTNPVKQGTDLSLESLKCSHAYTPIELENWNFDQMFPHENVLNEKKKIYIELKYCW